MPAKWKVTARHTKNILRWGAEAVVEEAVDLSNPESPQEYVYDIEHVDTHQSKRVLSHRRFDPGDLIEESAWTREA